eukprot:EG_transcript_11272
MASKSPKGPSAKEKKRLQKEHEKRLKESREQVDAGLALFDKGKYAPAITSFAAAIELNPDNAEAYLHRGRAQKELKEYDKAIADFSKALELNPEEPAAFSARGGAYECIQDYDRAIEDYSNVIELVPDNDHAYNMRGNARQARRLPGLKLKNAEFASVLSDFTKAIELNPNNYYAYNNRGNAYFDRKDFRSAMEDHGQAIQIKADYAYSYLRRGIAACEAVLYDEKLAKQPREEGDEEEEDSKKAKAPRDPSECTAQWEQEFRAMEEAEQRAKERERLLESAVADLRMVLTFDDSDIEAYTLRAKVYDMLGKEAEAKADRNKILELEVKAAQAAARR